MSEHVFAATERPLLVAVQPDRKGLMGVLRASWPLIAAVTLLLALNVAILWLANASRSAVAAESLWSKSQQDAVQRLVLYSQTGNAAHYRAFTNSIAVTLGDQKARLELEKRWPDLDLISQGLLQGRNHPSDLAGLMALFIFFRHYPGMDVAVEKWTRGDALVERLMALATRLHGMADPPRDPATPQIIQEIERIDSELRPLEEAFSAAVGAATRQLSLLLGVVALAVALLSIGFGMLMARGVMGRLRRAEFELRQINERFEMATTGSDHGIWDWNIATGGFYWSQRLRELLGYESAESFNQAFRLRAKLHPDDADETLHAIRRHLAERTSLFDSEFRLQCNDGRYRWFHARGRATWGHSGKAERFAGTIADVSQRKLAEQVERTARDSLQKMSEELDLALMGAAVALWAFDPDTGAVVQTRRWGVLLGRDVMPATFDEWQAQLIHPDDRERHLGTYLRLLQGELEHCELEYRMRHAQGHWVHVRTRGKIVERDPQGVALRYAGAVMDITAEVALRGLEATQRQFLKAMLESVNIGVMVLTTTEMVYMNSSIRRVLGYAPEEPVSGIHLDEIIDGRDQATVRQRRQKILEGSKVPVGLMRLKHRKGAVVEMAMTLTGFSWQGKPHFITSGTPVSENDMAAAHLQTANFDRALVSELESQQSQIARELHDSLGSTLTGVSLMLGSLTATAPADSPTRLPLDRALGQVTAAIEMTRALARGLMPVGSQTDGTQRALEQLSSDICLVTGVNCHFETDGHFAQLPSEVGGHLYRIAQEAIGNAIRHGHARNIGVHLLDEGDLSLLKVIDDGTGFNLPVGGLTTSGIGMQSMSARARAIGGVIRFERSTSGGCAVLVEWPSHRPALVRARTSGATAPR